MTSLPSAATASDSRRQDRPAYGRWGRCDRQRIPARIRVPMLQNGSRRQRSWGTSVSALMKTPTRLIIPARVVERQTFAARQPLLMILPREPLWS